MVKKLIILIGLIGFVNSMFSQKQASKSGNVIAIHPLRVQDAPLVSPAQGSNDGKYIITSDKNLKEHIFNVDLEATFRSLKSTPKHTINRSEWTKISLPNAEGVLMHFDIAEDPISAPELYNLYPQNRTYKLRSDLYSGVLYTSSTFIKALILTDTEQIFIEPTENGQYISFVPSLQQMKDFECKAIETRDEAQNVISKRSLMPGHGSNLRTYRIAIAATGEFSNIRSNNLATINADINGYVAALNLFYERETSIRFTRVSGDNLIFFDPNTDGLDPSNEVNTAQSVINATMGSANYDIGHAVHRISSGGSGVAYVGATCIGSIKAGAWSGGSNNSILLSIMYHEIGHQLGAPHTFYGTSFNCVNRSVGFGFEPGSGTSLMAYAGLCQQNGSCTYSHNITPAVNTLYLHSSSLQYITSRATTQTCGTNTAQVNDIPVVTVPSARSIPISTPFIITGSATDSNPLTYHWEEMDFDNLSLSCPNGQPNDAATSTTAPLFRSYNPSASGNTRIFPKIQDIIANTQVIGEILPTVARTINLRLVARDNLGATFWENVALSTVATAGPFIVNTANTTTAYTPGQSVTVTWNVANTNMAPISCANVEIAFSTDGGLTFPTILVSTTPNDGSQDITLPNVSTSLGRFRIKAENNYFFDINNANFVVSGTCNQVASTIVDVTPIVANAASPTLILNPVAGQILSSFTGIINSGSPVSTNAVALGSIAGSCTSYNSAASYAAIKFAVNVDGNYTMNHSASTIIAPIGNLYQGSFNPSSVCQNWNKSSASLSGSTVSITNTTSTTFVRNQIYEYRIASFYNADYGNYDVSLSGPSSSTFYRTEFLPAGYLYTYIIVRNGTTPVIAGISTNANLSNGTIYTSGSYSVRGFAYLSSNNLAPYINQSFSSFQSAVSNGTICGQLSSNFIPVTINGCTPSSKVVTSTLDDGSPTTLRSTLANLCPGDVVTFNVPVNSTVLLSSPVVISSNVIVNGSAIANLGFSGSNSVRIFEIASGVNATIQSLRLINANSASNGGAIYNLGNLTLNNVTFQNNFQGAVAKPFTNSGTINIAGNVQILP